MSGQISNLSIVNGDSVEKKFKSSYHRSQDYSRGNQSLMLARGGGGAETATEM